jgi:hypothetical protein
MTKSTLGTITAACTIILSLTGQVRADTCDILAANLKQDTLQQGSSEEKFHLLQQLIANDEFKDFNKASTTTIGGGGSYLDMVDGFLNVASTGSTWEQDRSRFLSLTYDEASSKSTFSTAIAKWPVDATKAIADCAETLATAEGFFAQLTLVNDDRSALAILIRRSTTGAPAWSLTNLTANPPDPNFICNGDDHLEQASSWRPKDIPAQTLNINCSKSPDKDVVVTLNTSAGAKSATFDIQSRERVMTDLKDRLDRLERAVARSSFRPGDVVISLLQEGPFLDQHGPGWALCDRRPVPGTAWATTVGTTQLPDFKGKYPRGYMDSLEGNPHPGDPMPQSLQQHTHFLQWNGRAVDFQGGYTQGGDRTVLAIGAGSGSGYPIAPPPISPGADGRETRPETVVVNFYCRIQ